FRGVVADYRAQPFVVGVLEGDLAGPLLAVEKFLVTLRQLRWRDQVGVVGGRVVIGVDAVPAAVRVAGLRNEAARPRGVGIQQRLLWQPGYPRGDREIPPCPPASAFV